MKKLILISGSPCVGKTTVGQHLFDQYENSAYLDGDWCWCVNPFSVKDPRLRNGDKSMSFVLSNYLNSNFEYVFFTSVVLTDAKIREAFREEIPGITKLIIAQRVASVQDADLILVLDGGQLVAQGTHETLLQTSQIYREVYESQVKGGEE